MSEYRLLRPVRHASERAKRSHVFFDEDYWFPWRMAACGKEVEGDTLTDERVDMVAVCLHCRKWLAAQEREEVAA